MKRNTNVQYIHTLEPGASAPETAAAPALDEFDRSFWAAKVKLLTASEACLRTAQAQAATARADLEGFARYIKEKYALADETEIAPDGTIVRRAPSSGRN